MTQSTNFVGGPCLAGPPVVVFTDDTVQLNTEETLTLIGKKNLRTCFRWYCSIVKVNVVGRKKQI